MPQKELRKDMEDNSLDEKPYIKEKIKKNHSRGIGKWFMRFFLAICVAVVFGVTAGVTFVIVRPWMEKKGIILATDTKETTAESVELRTYPEPDDTSPEPTTQEDSPSVPDDSAELSDAQKAWIRSQINAGLGRYSLNSGDYGELDGALNAIYRESCFSLAFVTSGSVTMPGVIIHFDGDGELLILTNTTQLAAEGIKVSFYPLQEMSYDAVVKGYDHVYGLSVISVDSAAIPEDLVKKLRAMPLGNNFRVNECDTVMAIGSPYVTPGSVGVGRVTGIKRNISSVDSCYTMFYTDISIPEGGTGFLIDIDGALVGVMTSSASPEYPGYAAAVATDEITMALNSMCSGRPASLLGIYGQTVTPDMVSAHAMPQGVYISAVLPGNAAYNAGISAGDIIVGISTEEITTVDQLTRKLLSAHLPNETVILRIMRDSADGYKEMSINVTLGAR